jgi:transposase-like protein
MSCCASSGGGTAAARKTCHLPGVHCTYFDLYRMKTDRHWLHQKLVAFARANGLKAAAREFGCSRNTVRKWLRRHVPGKPSALAERSRRPKHCPHQTSAALEGVIVRLRKQTAFGAERLKHEFATTPSLASSVNTS